MSNELNRRDFVGKAAAVAGAVAMAPLLSACGDGGQQQTGGNSTTGLKKALPAYVPSTTLKPDIPSVSNGPDVASDPGYLRYPSQHPATVSGVPGKGGKYTAITPLWGTVPSPGNSFYQAMNKALGVDLTIKPADGNNYATIIPTMTAAKRLPDWIQLPSWWNDTFNVGRLVGSQLAELTPYLSGDKIKKYPNLAAIPSGAWQAGVWGDKLYGLPGGGTKFSVAGAVFYRRDVLEAKGITSDEVTSAADLMNLGKELTDAKRGVWAFDQVWTYLFSAWDIPPTWLIEDGKLVHKYELPQFLEALDWHHKLAKGGYMHPDALADTPGDTRFYSGKTLIAGGGTGIWHIADHQAGTAADKNYRRDAFNIISADGKRRPTTFMGGSTSTMSYLNAKLKPSQVEELLEVANYLAAPYGSREYTMVNYGVEGVHYTMKDGVPTATNAGQKFVQPTTYGFLARPPSVISNQGADVVTRDYTAWQAANVKALYKPVFWNMNISKPQAMATALAAQTVEDAIGDCTRGKKKVSDVQAAIASWKSSSGERLKQWMTENVLDKYGSGQ